MGSLFNGIGDSRGRFARWLTMGMFAGILCQSSVMAGCAAERKAPQEATSADRQAALVSMSVAYHRRADLALSEGRRDEAKGELERLVAECYRYQIWSDEGLDVLYDSSTRLARMKREDKELSEAVGIAKRALEIRQETPSLFRGYLHQTMADLLEDDGKPKKAVEEHGRAIEVFKGILERRPAVPDAQPPAVPDVQPTP